MVAEREMGMGRKCAVKESRATGVRFARNTGVAGSVGNTVSGGSAGSAASAASTISEGVESIMR